MPALLLVSLIIVQFCFSAVGDGVSGQELPTSATITWRLNQSFSIIASSPSFEFTIFPFLPDTYQCHISNFTSNSSALVFPCFYDSPATPGSPTLSSTMFALCMTAIPPSYNASESFLVLTRPEIIWVANRDSPARGKKISRILQDDGDLVLRGYDDKGAAFTAWASNTSGQGVSSMQLLQNPANLVLSSDSGKTLWQSMDHLTDTLLIGQYLRIGRKLVSRASEGAYSLVVHPSHLVSLFYKKDGSPDSIPYWIWDSEFEQEPGLPQDLFSFFITPNGGLSAGNATIRTRSTTIPAKYTQTTFLRLETDGSLRLYYIDDYDLMLSANFFSDESGCFLPQSCGDYGVCVGNRQCSCPYPDASPSVSPSFVLSDPFNPEKGCRLVQPLSLTSCDNATIPSSAMPLHNTTSQDHVMMQLFEGVDYFSHATSSLPMISMSSQDDQGGHKCSELCLQNCTCLAAFWTADLNACLHISQHQMGSFRGGLDTTNHKAYLKVTVPSPSQSPKPMNRAAAVSIGAGVGGFVIGAVVLFCLYRKGYIQRNGLDAMHVYGETDILGNAGTSKLPTRFTYQELEDATEGFSHKLGKGGFGTVYAGVLSDHMTRVAVKKLEGIRQGEREFKTELKIMADIHHFNLLQLMGYCAEGADRRLLVYKYMEKGSLDQWLFASKLSDQSLSGLEDAALRSKWGLRYSVAVGVAKGLAYLHEECEEHILHLDIKPHNILLDENFVPKVADFGLARGMGREMSHVVTMMRGTPGYLAPEWLKEGAIDVKCDVFSFGMLLMEIVSGRKNADPHATTAPYYPTWAYSHIVANKLLLDTTGSEVTINGQPAQSILSYTNESPRPRSDPPVHAHDTTNKQEASTAHIPICGMELTDADIESEQDRAHDAINKQEASTGPIPIICTIDMLTDAEIKSEQDRAELCRLLTTAFLCVLEKPEWRPSMGKVVQMLEGLVPISHVDISLLHQGLTFVLGSHDCSRPCGCNRSDSLLRREFQRQLDSILHLAGDSTTTTTSSSKFSQLSGR